ncbi:helix-turn-helix domain-containing protein [Aliirhizobium smilacinae]|uniref:Helix-turn-helix transcriptional regulator n=1 Tax=Aliirhizobium smilacinae TaxID=1395944 RepID=A0A5C4XRT9_9HYPH|nr:AraC family transcriptional regulator [Rhizobium smilacinae]TNM66306.1 helix-turn-helix transcriptional regulator [Rhizobium smilacinae]
MLAIPLPFIAGLIFALVLHHSLKGVEAPGSRRYFVAFLILYALQGVVVGLHLGYGVKQLAPIQPITASVMPPLAFLAFRGLTDASVPRPWIHLWAPLSVALSVALLPVLVDPILLVIFLVYGFALWRLTRESDDEVMAEASLQRMRPALRAARLTAILMFFFAVSDVAVAIYAGLVGVEGVPFAVAIMNIIALAATGVYYVLPQRGIAPVSLAMPYLPEPGDEAVVARATMVLEEGGLYKNENLSLAKIARKAGIPARDLSAAINRATGLNVSQFVNNRRVEEACRLLDETRQSATVIMLDVGFSTKSNFNREFRRVTGLSPRQWRARSKDGTAPVVARS